jgi:hypothetical protein
MWILCADSGEEKDVLKVEGNIVVRKIVAGDAPQWLSKVTLADGLQTSENPALSEML